MNQLVRLPYIGQDAAGPNVVVGCHGLASESMFADAELMDLVVRSFMVRGVRPELRQLGDVDQEWSAFRSDETNPPSPSEADVQRLFSQMMVGGLWLTIDRVDRVDARLRAITDQLYDDIGQQLPGFHSVETSVSLHISSPLAVSPFLLNGPSEIIWQVRGSSEAWCYPGDERVVPRHVLEDVFVGCQDGVVHDCSHDVLAQPVNLVEGEVAIWPQNAPRRQLNGADLCVTLVTHHFTKDARRKSRVYQANRFLRTTFGVSSARLSTDTRGPRAICKVIAHKVGQNMGLEKCPEPPREAADDRTLPGRKAAPRRGDFDSEGAFPNGNVNIVHVIDNTDKVSMPSLPDGEAPGSPSTDVPKKQPVAIG